MSDPDKYLKLSEDMKKLVNGSAKEQMKSGMAIIGKSLFNVGKFAATEFLPVMKNRLEKERRRLKEEQLKNDNSNS